MEADEGIVMSVELPESLRVPGVAYRAIEEFSFYIVGDDGSVFGCQRRGVGAGRPGVWRKLLPRIVGRGYHAIMLCRPGVRRRVYIHALVLEVFVGPRPNGMESCHGNGVITDNRLANLRWDTSAANQADRIRHGTDHRGEKQYKAKLTAEQVKEIRRRASCGQTATQIAKDYPVSDATIGNVIKRQTWQHVA